MLNINKVIFIVAARIRVTMRYCFILPVFGDSLRLKLESHSEDMARVLRMLPGGKYNYDKAYCDVEHGYN